MRGFITWKPAECADSSFACAMKSRIHQVAEALAGHPARFKIIIRMICPPAPGTSAVVITEAGPLRAAAFAKSLPRI
jgi:hypothetical protein